MKHIIRSATGALVAGMFVAGCSSTPSASDQANADAAIGNASQAIDHASGDPHVAKYASSELDRASESLGKAKTAWNDKHDLQATTHYAYIAQQRAATAQELASQRAADEQVAVLTQRRDRAVAMLQERRSEQRAEQRVEVVPGTSSGQSLAGFGFGKSTVPAHAKSELSEVASTLKSNPGQVVVIEGHTDNVGSPDYNHGLAMKRAEAVRAALVRDGVESSRITIQSQGEQNPIASNDTSDGRKENRRVQVMVGNTNETAMGSSQAGSATASGSGDQSGQKAHKGKNAQSGQNAESAQDGDRDR
jgi:outer membrane protein OmpA-like peptidoglycan-associated protein